MIASAVVWRGQRRMPLRSPAAAQAMQICCWRARELQPAINIVVVIQILCSAVRSRARNSSAVAILALFNVWGRQVSTLVR